MPMDAGDGGGGWGGVVVLRACRSLESSKDHKHTIKRLNREGVAAFSPEQPPQPPRPPRKFVAISSDLPDRLPATSPSHACTAGRYLKPVLAPDAALARRISFALTMSARTSSDTSF